MIDVPSGLVLVCQVCRWHPPEDLPMGLVQSHFDIEPDHDPENLRMELTAWCSRCDLEMTLDHFEHLRSGGNRLHYSCGRCHRSHVVNQKPSKEE